MSEESRSETALYRFAKRHPVESIQTWSAVLLLAAILAVMAAAAAVVFTRDTIARTYADLGVALPAITGFWLTTPEWLFYVLAGAVILGLSAKEIRLRNSIHAMGVNATVALLAMTALAVYFYCMLLPVGTIAPVIR